MLILTIFSLLVWLFNDANTQCKIQWKCEGCTRCLYRRINAAVNSRSGFVLSGCVEEAEQQMKSKYKDIMYILTSSERLEVRHFPFTPSPSVSKCYTCPSCPSVPNSFAASSNPYCCLPTSFNVFPHGTQFPRCQSCTGLITTPPQHSASTRRSTAQNHLTQKQ